MKRSLITLLALAGVTGLVVGGEVFGMLGVFHLLLAVWGIVGNHDLKLYHAELDRAYPPLPTPEPDGLRPPAFVPAYAAFARV